MIKERNELATSALSGLFDFWRTKHCGEKPPVASTIAPADLRLWKDNIVIFEVIGDGEYVYSYYGQALATAFGHSRLGATLDELPTEQRAILLPEYETVRREKIPVTRIYTADFDGVIRSWERLALPLSSDGQIIDKLLVAAYELDPDIADLARAIATDIGNDDGSGEIGRNDTPDPAPPDSAPLSEDIIVPIVEAAHTPEPEPEEEPRPAHSGMLVDAGIPSLDLMGLAKPRTAQASDAVGSESGPDTETKTDRDTMTASTGISA